MTQLVILDSLQQKWNWLCTCVWIRALKMSLDVWVFSCDGDGLKNWNGKRIGIEYGFQFLPFEPLMFINFGCLDQIDLWFGS